MLFDSHVHFETIAGAEGLEARVKRAREAGVGRMVVVGGNSQMNEVAIEGAELHPGQVYAAIGCDREQNCDGCDPVEFMDLLNNNRRIVAVGEIGLDYFHHPEKPNGQREIFEKMLDIATAAMRPIIIHSRNADEEMLEMLGAHAKTWKGDDGRLGVLHCFTGSKEFAYKILDLGYHIGFSGIMTFRNADDLRELAAEIPSERILIETDTPYLAPVPCRGQTNEPAFLVHVAQMLADVRKISLEEVAEITSHNSCRLFGI